MLDYRRRLAAAFALTYAALASPALAHHPGGGGNTGEAGPIFTIPASTLDEGQTAVGVMFEYVRLRTLSDQTLTSAAVAGNEGVHDLQTIESTSAILAYGITHDLTVSMRVPWVGRTGIREGNATDPLNPIVVDRGSSFGFSDVTLLGQYRFFNDKKAHTEAAVLLGVKAPTGLTNRVDNQGLLFDAEFQPGTGAWNGLFGLAVTKRFGSWSLDGNVLYVLSSTGTQDTNLGDRFLYNAALSYRLTGATAEKNGHTHMHLGGDLPAPMYHGGPKGNMGHSQAEPAASPTSALDLVVELNGEWHDRQVTAGVTDQNSGGTAIYISPGLRLSYDRWSTYVSLAIPVVNEPEWSPTRAQLASHHRDVARLLMSWLSLHQKKDASCIALPR
jgi:Putative MetA-pathway of phenol degradation